MRHTIHVCGIRDEQGQPRLDSAKVTTCPEGETVHDAYERIRSNIEHFRTGGVCNVIRTWPLGARPMDASEIRFDDRSERVDMWHIVSAASPDDWARKP